MSGNVKIFLETGKKNTPEFVFIKALLKHIGKTVDDDDIESLGGWTNLKRMFSQLSRKPDIEKILIVFDADSAAQDAETGGFCKRRAHLEKVVGGNAKAGIFLFPNNSDDGDLETLLEQILNRADNEQFLDCFSDFEKCLGDKYEHPNRKAKLHSYINLQKGLSNQERKNLGRGEWLFDDNRFWDLNHPALAPLKKFFAENL